MAEFCTCGSIIINNKCTNKNCELKTGKTGNVSAPKRTSRAKAKTVPTESIGLKSETKKPTSASRRSSKCVTYKLSEFLENDGGSNSGEGNDYSKKNDDVEDEDESLEETDD